MPSIRRIAATWPLRIILRTVELVVVAALFALSGAWSSQFFSQASTTSSKFWADFFLGVPFALVCVALLVRNAKAALVLPAIILAWPIAHFAATFIKMTSGDEYWPMGVAGLIGALCVALAIGIARRQLLTPWRLGGAALVGYLAGLSFDTWLTYYTLRINSVPDPLQPTRLRDAFAIWQCAVGTYIYSISKG
jgi:hypothetical protein